MTEQRTTEDQLADIAQRLNAKCDEQQNIIRDQGNAIADLRAKNEALTIRRAEDKQAVVAVFSAHITAYGYDPGTMLDVLNLLEEKIT